MSVSVALRPTPTTSTLDGFVMSDPATVKEAREFSKADRLCQLKRGVRQRARPQIIRNKTRTAVKSAAGDQCNDICGTRDMTAKITKTLEAANTKSQASTLRDGINSAA